MFDEVFATALNMHLPGTCISFQSRTWELDSPPVPWSNPLVLYEELAWQSCTKSLRAGPSVLEAVPRSQLSLYQAPWPG
jgi:hypothetical protein